MGTNTHPSDTDGSSAPSDNGPDSSNSIRPHKKLEREERWVVGPQPDLQNFEFRTRLASADSSSSGSKPMQLGNGVPPKMTKRDLEGLSMAKTRTEHESLLSMIRTQGVPRETSREHSRKGKRRLSSSRRRSQDRGSPKLIRSDVRNSPHVATRQRTRENERIRQKSNATVEPAPQTEVVELVKVRASSNVNGHREPGEIIARKRDSVGSVDSASSLMKEVLGNAFLNGTTNNDPSLPSSTRIRRTRSTPSTSSVRPTVRSSRDSMQSASPGSRTSLPKSNTTGGDTSMLERARSAEQTKSKKLDDYGHDRPMKKIDVTRTESTESFDNLMRNMLMGGVRIEPEEICSSSHTLTQKLDNHSPSSTSSEDDSTLVSERSAFLGSNTALSSRSTSSSTGLQWLFGIDGETPLDQGKCCI